MNLLPSMLIATTLIGGAGNMQAEVSAAAVNIDNCINGQVIVGNSANMESILGNMGVDIDSLKDYIIPSVPGTNCPTPEIPDMNTPDSEIPDAAPETPDTDIPDTDIPDTEAPDMELPDSGAPDVNTPENKPDSNPGNDTEQDAVLSYAEQVVALVNAERAKANLPALTISDDLNAAALIRAKETTKSFSHTRPNGSSFSSVLSENGISYRGSGENIAWGQSTPEAVVNAWMNSEGHRANILNNKFTSIGVGYYLNNSTPYWAQLFTY